MTAPAVLPLIVSQTCRENRLRQNRMHREALPGFGRSFPFP